MPTEVVKRKVTAILSADVKGYSRLMEEDEATTVQTLKARRELITSFIEKHRGRVVDSPGDNILAEFASVVEAVDCAVKIQGELKAKNTELPENRRMEFRIGVHLGDIIEDEERIYGDGVNIAARIEGMAEAGGICVSRTAYDSVKNKLKLGFEYLGEHTVKNISEPVQVYRVLTEPEAVGKVIGEEKLKPRQWRWAAIGGVVVLILMVGALAIWNFYFRPAFEPASVEKMAFPLPDKPSIAVLPFVNMSGDPEQDYFSDGLTEEIISALSRVPKLFVISRNSTFTYKGKPVKVQQVSEELGVRYVLEGSVRKAEDRVRITAQLIDATTGHHLRSERYDRELKDIFAIQDEVTIKIITSLQVELTEGEQACLFAKDTDNLTAYLNYLRGKGHFYRQTGEGMISARRFFKEAITLDPEFPRPYGLLASTHMMDVILGTTKSTRQSMKRAVQLAQKAISLDDSFAPSHAVLGFAYTMLRQHDMGIAEGRRSVALDPNGATSHGLLSNTLSFSGRCDEAVQMAEKAIRLNPLPSARNFRDLAWAYVCAGRYEEAIATYKKVLSNLPNDRIAHASLTLAYCLSGREEEARAQAVEVLRIDPKYSLDYRAKVLPYKNKAHLERDQAALRKAGIPETPPLPLPDKPSIAVLPFVNMSGDPEQEYFSDGLTESIITGLSKTPKLFVIARNSTFTYKGKPTNVQKVGSELGVRYVLEGSVQKSADRVRITAQLVDAKSGSHVWAEQYDRDLKEIFALQDEITMKILTALQVKLTMGEHARVYGKGTNNLEAYLKFLQGREYSLRMNREDNIRAREMAEEAIALDPSYAEAYVLLARTHQMDVWLRSTRSPEKSLALTYKLAQKALSLDESTASAHSVLASIYLLRRQHEKALDEAEQALALEPNSAIRHALLGRTLIYDGRPEEAVPLLKRALRLSPIPEGFTLYTLGFAYTLTGQYEKAIEAYRKAIGVEPENLWSHVLLTTAYSLAGLEEEARAEAGEVLRINLEFTVEHFGKTLPFKTEADKELIISALRKAKLK